MADQHHMPYGGARAEDAHTTWGGLNMYSSQNNVEDGMGLQNNQVRAAGDRATSRRVLVTVWPRSFAMCSGGVQRTDCVRGEARVRGSIKFV